MNTFRRTWMTGTISLALLLGSSMALAQEDGVPAGEAVPALADEGSGVASVVQRSSNIQAIFGVPMWPLWACSLVLVALIFERFAALRARKVMDAKMTKSVTEALANLNLDEAETIAGKSKTIVGQGWAQGLREYRLAGGDLAEKVTDAMALAMKPLKRNLKGITTIATISPLFGLLGTIVGMIMTFDEIAFSAGADKEKLAAGIMVALFTTAFGLIIAIPGIVCGRYFTAKVTTYAEEVENDIHRAHQLHAQTQSERGAPVRAKAAPTPVGVPEPVMVSQD